MKETKFNKKKAFINVPFDSGTVQIFADYATTIEGYHFFIHKQIREVKDGQAEFWKDGYTLTEFSTGVSAKRGAKTKVVNEFIELINKPENDLKTELAKYEVLNLDVENYIENVILAKPKAKKQTEKISVKSALQGAKIFYEKNDISKDAIAFDKKFIPFVFDICESANGLKFKVSEHTETFEDSKYVAGVSYVSGKFEKVEKTITANMLQISHDSGSYTITLNDINLMYFIPTLKAICAQYSIEFIDLLNNTTEVVTTSETFAAPENIQPKPNIRRKKAAKKRTLYILPQVQNKRKKSNKDCRKHKVKRSSQDGKVRHSDCSGVIGAMIAARLILYNTKYPLIPPLIHYEDSTPLSRFFTPNTPSTIFRENNTIKTNIINGNYCGNTNRFRLHWTSG